MFVVDHVTLNASICDRLWEGVSVASNITRESYDENLQACIRQ